MAQNCKETLDRIKSKGVNVAYVFQTRDPTLAGHAYIMHKASKNLKRKPHLYSNNFPKKMKQY